MTANFTEPSFTGSRSSWGGGRVPTHSSARIRTNSGRGSNERRMASPHLPDHVGNVVDDDVGRGVAKDQVLADDAVLELLRERRQVQQQIRWNRGQRRAL